MKPAVSLLMLACLVAAPAALAAGPGPAPRDWANDLSPLRAADWNAPRAAHLLERAGFGGTPQEVAKLAAMTPAEAVDHLVDYCQWALKPRHRWAPENRPL